MYNIKITKENKIKKQQIKDLQELKKVLEEYKDKTIEIEMHKIEKVKWIRLMNNDIKEILDKLSSEKYYIQHSYCRLFNYEANVLLDYITNLQEEIEQLKEDKKELQAIVESWEW